MRDCRKCRDWRGCAGAPWFSYGDLRFCPSQMLWLLWHLEELLIGEWPKDPDGASALDVPSVDRPFKAEAYFTKPAEIAAEIESRLRRTGVDGKLLKLEIQAGVYMAELQYEARQALKYISGWRRKGKAYRAWKNGR